MKYLNPFKLFKKKKKSVEKEEKKPKEPINYTIDNVDLDTLPKILTQGRENEFTNKTHKKSLPKNEIDLINNSSSDRYVQDVMYNPYYVSYLDKGNYHYSISILPYEDEWYCLRIKQEIGRGPGTRHNERAYICDGLPELMNAIKLYEIFKKSNHLNIIKYFSKYIDDTSIGDYSRDEWENEI